MRDLKKKSNFFIFFLDLDFKAFQQASELFQPYIKFFATFEKSVSISVPNKLRCCSFYD